MILRDFWFGPEVEGRLSGIETMFVRNTVPVVTKLIPHVYFTVEFVRANKPENWDAMRTMRFEEGKIVSIEVDDGCFENVPADLFNACHIIYRVKGKFMDRLKKLDTVTVDVRPYNIFWASKDHMTHVPPDAYGVDKDNP